MKVTISRIYDDRGSDDSFRVLVDRLWPRGIRKEDASLDLWARELAPSSSLRKWFHQHPQKWDEFQQLYIEELNSKKNEVSEQLEAMSKHQHVKLLYSSRDEVRNNAAVLREWLLENLRG